MNFKGNFQKNKRKLPVSFAIKVCVCDGAFVSALFVRVCVSSAGLALVIVAFVRPRLPIAVLEEHLDAAPQ